MCVCVFMAAKYYVCRPKSYAEGKGLWVTWAEFVGVSVESGQNLFL